MAMRHRGLTVRTCHLLLAAHRAYSGSFAIDRDFGSARARPAVAFCDLRSRVLGGDLESFSGQRLIYEESSS